MYLILQEIIPYIALTNPNLAILVCKYHRAITIRDHRKKNIRNRVPRCLSNENFESIVNPLGTLFNREKTIYMFFHLV